MTDAALYFDVDSSRARTAATDLAKLQNAATKLAGEWSKTDNALRRTNGQFANSTEVVEKYGREVQQLAAKYNPALNAVYKFQQAEAELNRAVALGVLTKQQAAEALDRISVKLRDTANASAQAMLGVKKVTDETAKMGKQMETGSGHTANVFAQLNDIGVMMLYQSPFQLALQQGTQLNQVWAAMGAQGRSLAGVAGVLRNAFMSMLSPMSLITIGVIAGTAAFAQWVFKAGETSDKAKTLKDQLDGLAAAVTSLDEVTRKYSIEGIQQLIDRYGELNAEVLLLLERQREFAMNEAMRAASEAISGANSELSDFIRQFDVAITIGGSRLNKFTRQWDISVEAAIDLRNAVRDVENALTPIEKSRAISKLLGLMEDTWLEGTKVNGVLLQTQDELMRLYNISNQGGWFNAAIDGASTLLGKIMQAATAVAAARQQEAAFAGGLGERPQGRPFELGIPEIPKGGGGSRGGGGGGESAVDKMQEEMKSRWETLNKGFQSEYMLAMQHYEKDIETLDWALSQKIIKQEEYNENISMLHTTAWGAEWEKQALQYQMDQDALQAALDQKLITQEEYYRKLKEMQFANLMSDVNRTDMAQDLANTAQYFGMLNSLTGSGFDGLLRLQKSFAAASALINAWKGYTDVLAQPDLPWWTKLAAAGKVLAAGLGAVSAIKGAGGGSGGGSTAATSAATPTAAQEPTREVLVRLDGTPWLVDLAEGVMQEIYQQSKDGRVIVARAN